MILGSGLEGGWEGLSVAVVVLSYGKLIGLFGFLMISLLENVGCQF